MIPKSFDCGGRKIRVEIGGLENSNSNGTYDHDEGVVAVSKRVPERNKLSVFWHEVVHCMLETAGYDKLSKNEKLVDRLAQLLAQKELTQRGDQ